MVLNTFLLVVGASKQSSSAYKLVLIHSSERDIIESGASLLLYELLPSSLKRYTIEVIYI